MQQDTDKALKDWQYCDDTIRVYRDSMVYLAERLWRIHDKALWQGQWSSWEEYLEELGMKKGTASKLCALYYRIVIELKFPTETLRDAPWTNLYIALPMMKDKETAEVAIEKAASLRGSDLLADRYQHQHGKECSHEHSSPFLYCADCKRWIKVYEQDAG